jgi:hypothetical protein
LKPPRTAAEWAALLRDAPEDALRSEWARRNNAKRETRSGGRAPVCICGECRTCKSRLSMARMRAERAG